MEQIAGDELWPASPEARVATAFSRHYPDESNARVLQQRRQEILDDVTDATGAVFLGLTYGCARCHNHKFDPILQADYYRLQAFFANTAADDHIQMLSPDQRTEFRRKKAIWEEATSGIRVKIAALLDPLKQKASTDYFDKYPPEIQAMILKPAAQRNAFEWQMYAKAKPYLEIADEEAVKQLKGEQKQNYDSLIAELAKFEQLNPGELPEGIGMADLSRNAPATHILGVGNYLSPKEEVQPGFLTLLGSDAGEDRTAGGRGIHRTANRPGQMAGGSGKSAARAGDGEPDLALPFRQGNRGHAERFWNYGRAADAIRNCWTG